MNGIESPDTDTLVECITTGKSIDTKVKDIRIEKSASWITTTSDASIFYHIPVHLDFARQLKPGNTVRITVEHIPEPPEPDPEEDPES